MHFQENIRNGLQSMSNRLKNSWGQVHIKTFDSLWTVCVDVEPPES